MLITHWSLLAVFHCPRTFYFWNVRQTMTDALFGTCIVFLDLKYVILLFYCHPITYIPLPFFMLVLWLFLSTKCGMHRGVQAYEFLLVCMCVCCVWGHTCRNAVVIFYHRQSHFTCSPANRPPSEGPQTMPETHTHPTEITGVCVCLCVRYDICIIAARFPMTKWAWVRYDCVLLSVIACGLW